MPRINRSFSTVTPLSLQATIRDHELVLTGRIEDDNLYIGQNLLGTTQRVPISEGKVLDLPTNKNGVRSNKFILNNGGESFYNDIWLPLLEYMNETHDYRIASAGPQDTQSLNAVVGKKDGREDDGKLKTVKLVIEKPENWKLLYVIPNRVNDVFTGFEYTVKRDRAAFPQVALSFEMSKNIYEAKKTGIDAVLVSVYDEPERAEFNFRLIFNGVDVQDEYVFFLAQVNVGFEVIL